MPYINNNDNKTSSTMPTTSIMSSKAGKFRSPDDYAQEQPKQQASVTPSTTFTSTSVDTSINSTYSVMKELFGAYAAGDTERQNAIADLYSKGVTDSKSPWYNPYVNATANTYYDEMRNMGINVPTTGVSADILNEWKKLSDYSNVDANNVPMKPSKTSTVYQDMAYYLYKLDGIEATTQTAEAEWAGLQSEIGWLVGAGYSDDEVMSRIEWDNYPTLQKMDEGRQAYTPLPLTRAVGYSPDALYGVLWQARNPDFEGDIYSAIGNYANGWGKQYVPDPKSVASGDNKSSYYHPYFNGTSLNYSEYAKYLPKGNTTFTWDWLSKNEDNEDIPEKVKSTVRKSLENADKATDELNKLKKQVAGLVAKGYSSEKILKSLNIQKTDESSYRIMDKDLNGDKMLFYENYPTLYAMEYKRSVGGAEQLAYAVDFALPYFVKSIEYECAKKEQEDAEAKRKLDEQSKLILSGDMDESLAAGYNAKTNGIGFMAQFYASMDGMTEQEQTAKQTDLTYDIGKYLNGTPLNELSLDAQQFIHEYSPIFSSQERIQDLFGIIREGKAQTRQDVIGFFNGLSAADEALKKNEITSAEFAQCLVISATAYETARLRGIDINDASFVTTELWKDTFRQINKICENGKERTKREKKESQKNYIDSYYEVLDEYYSGKSVSLRGGTAQLNEIDSNIMAQVNTYIKNIDLKADNVEDKTFNDIKKSVESAVNDITLYSGNGFNVNTTFEQKQAQVAGDIFYRNVVLDRALESYMDDVKLAQYMGMSLDELYEFVPERKDRASHDAILATVEDAKSFFNVNFGETKDGKSALMSGDVNSIKKLAREYTGLMANYKRDKNQEYAGRDMGMSFTENKNEKIMWSELEAYAREHDIDGYYTLDDKSIFYAIGRGVESGGVQYAMTWGQRYDYWVLQRSYDSVARIVKSKYDSREEYRTALEKSINEISDPVVRNENIERLAKYNGDIYNFDFDIGRQDTLDWLYERGQYIESIAKDVRKHCSREEYRAFEISQMATSNILTIAESAAVAKVAGVLGAPSWLASFTGTTFSFGLTSGAEIGNELQAQGLSLAESRKYAMGVAALTGALETFSEKLFTGSASILGKNIDDLSVALGNTAADMMSKMPKLANRYTVWCAKSVGRLAGAYIEESVEEGLESIGTQIITNIGVNEAKGVKNTWSNVTDISWEEVWSSTTDGGEMGVVLSVLLSPVKSAGGFFRTRSIVEQYANLDSLTKAQADAIVNAVNQDLADPAFSKALDEFAVQSEIDTRTAELMTNDNAVLVSEDIKAALETAQAKKAETQKALEKAQAELTKAEENANIAESLYMEAEEALGEDGTVPTPEAINNLNEAIDMNIKAESELATALDARDAALDADTKAQKKVDKVQQTEKEYANSVLEQYRQKAQAEVMESLKQRNAEKMKADALEKVRKTRADMEAEIDKMVADGKMSEYDAKRMKERIYKRSDKLLKTAYNIGKDGLKRSFESKMQGWTLNFADITENGEIDVDPSKRTITIDNKLSYAQAYMKVLSHEFTHMLKSENPNAWSKYANIVLSTIYGKNYEKNADFTHDVEVTANRYMEHGVDAETAKAQAVEEHVAHLTEQLVFGDDIIALERLMKFDRSSGKRLLGWVIDKLSGETGFTATDEYMKLRKARRVLEKGLRQVSKDTKKSGAVKTAVDTQVATDVASTDTAQTPRIDGVSETSDSAPIQTIEDSATPSANADTAAQSELKNDSENGYSESVVDAKPIKLKRTRRYDNLTADELNDASYDAKKMLNLYVDEKGFLSSKENDLSILGTDIEKLSGASIDLINDNGGIHIDASEIAARITDVNSKKKNARNLSEYAIWNLNNISKSARNVGLDITLTNINENIAQQIDASIKESGYDDIQVNVDYAHNELAKKYDWITAPTETAVDAPVNGVETDSTVTSTDTVETAETDSTVSDEVAETVETTDEHFDPPTEASEATEAAEQSEAVTETEQTVAEDTERIVAEPITAQPRTTAANDMAYKAKRDKAYDISGIFFNSKDGSPKTYNNKSVTAKEIAKLDNDTISILNDIGGLAISVPYTNDMFVQNSPLHSIIYEAYNKGIEVTIKNITSDNVNTIEDFLKKAGFMDANVRGIVKPENAALAKKHGWIEVVAVPMNAQSFIDAINNTDVDRINTTLFNLPQYVYDKATDTWHKTKDAYGRIEQKIDEYITANNLYGSFTLKTQSGRGSNTIDDVHIRNYRSNNLTTEYWKEVVGRRSADGMQIVDVDAELSRAAANGTNTEVKAEPAAANTTVNTDTVAENALTTPVDVKTESVSSDADINSVNTENNSANANTVSDIETDSTMIDEQVENASKATSNTDTKRYSLRDPADDLRYQEMLAFARDLDDPTTYVRLISDHVSEFTKRVANNMAYSYEVRTPSAIVAELAKSLDTDFTVMNMPSRETLATFDKHSNVIATSSMGTNDLSVTMYAIGERLKQMFDITKPDWAPDDFDFSLDFYKYMTQQDSAYDSRFASWFDGILNGDKKNAKVREAIDAAKHKISAYSNADAVQKVLSHVKMMSEGNRGLWHDFFKNINYNLHDSTAAAQKIDNIVGGTELRFAATYLPYGKRMADRLLHTSFMLPDGSIDKTKLSLADAIARSGLPNTEESYNRLVALLLAKHSLSRDKANKPIFGVDVDTAEMNRIINNATDAETAAANAIYSWWNDFMKTWVVDTGMMSKKEWDTMRATYPYYVPTYRYEEGTRSAKFQRAKGSDLPIYDPIAVMQSKVQAIVNAVQQNMLGLKLHELYQNADNKATLNLFAQQIDAPVDTYDVERSVTNLLDGTGAEDADIDALSRALEERIRTSYTGAGVSGDVLRVTLPDHTKAYYKIKDKPLFDLLSGMGKKKLDVIFNAAGRMTRLMTGLTTGANFIFMVKNAMRDFQKSVNYGSWASNYISGTVKWLVSFGDVLASKLGDDFNRDWGTKTFDDYQGLGGDYYELMNLNNKAGEVDARENIMRGYKWNSGLKNKLRAVKDIGFRLMTMSDLNQIIETTSRYAEYKYGKHNKSTIEGKKKAFMAAQEATIDFQRMGAHPISQALRRVVPFWNATLQGTYQSARMWTKGERSRIIPRMAKTIINNMLMGALTSGLIGAYGTDDELENYCLMSDTIRANYILLPNSWFASILGDGKVKKSFARIPLQQDWYAKAAFLLGQNLAAGLTDAPDGFAMDIMTVAKTLLGDTLQTGSIIDPILAVEKNTAWNDSTIISNRYDSSYYSQRGGENVSPLFFALSRALNRAGLHSNLTTPAGLQYIARQYTGIIGQVAQYTDGFDIFGGIAEAYSNAFTIDGTGVNDVDDEYYERKTLMSQITQAGKLGQPGNMLKPGLSKEDSTQAYELATAMNKSGGIFKETENRISEIWDEINEIQDSDYSDKDKAILIREKKMEVSRLQQDALMQTQEFVDKYVEDTSFGKRVTGVVRGMLMDNEVVVPMTPFEKLSDDFRNDENEEYMQEGLALFEANPTRTSLYPQAKHTFQNNGVSMTVKDEYADEFDSVYHDAYVIAANNILYSGKYQRAVEDESDTELDDTAREAARIKRLELWGNAHTKAQEAAKKWYLNMLWVDGE